MSNRERQFLASRQARFEERKLQQEKKDRKKAFTNAFWIKLRELLEAWRKELEAIGSEGSLSLASNQVEEGKPTRSEEDLRAIQIQICTLEDRLSELRDTCLTDPDFVPRGEERDTNDNNGVEAMPVIEWMSVNDMSLLHTEFSNCLTSLRERRENLLPKGKFVFRRYRAALEAMKHPPDILSEEKVPRRQRQSASLQSDPNQSLCDLSSRKLVVDVDGRVVDKCTGSVLKAVSGSSMLLRSLKDCDIEMYVFNFFVPY